MAQFYKINGDLYPVPDFVQIPGRLLVDFERVTGTRVAQLEDEVPVAAAFGLVWLAMTVQNPDVGYDWVLDNVTLNDLTPVEVEEDEAPVPPSTRGSGGSPSSPTGSGSGRGKSSAARASSST